MFFKLPITEISSVDDHNRVRIFNHCKGEPKVDLLQEISIILGYNMRWPEHRYESHYWIIIHVLLHRMILNESADWSRGGINISPDMIEHFWIPDIAIHNLVRKD